MKKTLIWIGALAVGALLGLLGSGWLDELFSFIATVYTRLFQFIAIPTIALAVMTTLSSLGKSRQTGRIFGRTVTYTLLTTFAAALVGLGMYLLIRPGMMPSSAVQAGLQGVDATELSYYDHILSVVPNNILNPFLTGNVLSVLIVAAAFGLGLAYMKDSENKSALVKAVFGFQELLFVLIKALVWSLPLGILAFSAQLTSQLGSGMIAGAVGKYVAVVLGGNVVQFVVVLPLFLIARGLDPLKILKGMSPAVTLALFSKSSAGTLPVTMKSAEENLGIDKSVSRFVLPICTTINMNGCAAFILVTSLFVMQNGGVELTFATMVSWLFISVISAVGNAGVPMGCYFLTLSLMSGQGMPLGIMGIILPIYSVIDMVETAVNVWSDSCVCAMTDRDFRYICSN